jgi:hypothetical protein
MTLRSDRLVNGPARDQIALLSVVRSLVMAIASLTLLVVALIATVLPASAATVANGAWSIAPADAGPGAPSNGSAFHFTGRAGEIFTDRFVVANGSPHDITFNLYAADGYRTTVGRAFALKLANERQSGVGQWIGMPTDKLSLSAGKEATVTYTMRIPLNAKPGNYAGGIVAQDGTPTLTSHGSFRIPVLEGAGVRVYVRVDG